MRNEDRNHHSQSSSAKETSSFKQIIKDVENLINDEQQRCITEFDTCHFKVPSILTPGMTNGEKINILMRDASFRQKVTQTMKQQGYYEVYPILKVMVISLDNQQEDIQLHQQDLQEVFRRFGCMQKVLIKPNGTYIFYSDYHSAYFAEKSLNQLYLKSLHARLMVTWCQFSDYTHIRQYLNLEQRQQEIRSTGHSKYTCRYQIGIENDKEFQVAKKIIGPRGLNMKKIIDTCLSEIGADPKTESDSIKLRLRGRGSGYRQGQFKQQSQQPLHLCVSCKDDTLYVKVCLMVDELLLNLYEEYKKYKLHSQKSNVEVKLRKMESNQIRNKCFFYNFDEAANNYQQQSGKLNESQIRLYIEGRNKARRQLNFAEADRIRNFLKSKGVLLIDEKGGRGRGVEVTTWKYAN